MSKKTVSKTFVLIIFIIFVLVALVLGILFDVPKHISGNRKASYLKSLNYIEGETTVIYKKTGGLQPSFPGIAEIHLSSSFHVASDSLQKSLAEQGYELAPFYVNRFSDDSRKIQNISTVATDGKHSLFVSYELTEPFVCPDNKNCSLPGSSPYDRIDDSLLKKLNELPISGISVRYDPDAPGFHETYYGGFDHKFWP